MAGFAPIFEAFSVSHAQILDGMTDFLTAMAAAYNQDTDVYGVAEAGLSPDTDSFSNEGDDTILSTWDWLNKGDLTVKSGYLSFPLIAALTGQPISSGTSAGKEVLAVDLWHEDAMSVAPKSMIIKMPSKDRDGNPADFVIGLYKVSFKPIQFDGPVYKDGLKVNYDGSALYSQLDELGQPFADGKKRVGRLLAVQK